MKGPPRLLESHEGDLVQQLLRSADSDVPPRPSKKRALAAATFAAASLVSGGKAVAGGTAGYWTATMLLKWLGLGVVLGTITLGAVQGAKWVGGSTVSQQTSALEATPHPTPTTPTISTSSPAVPPQQADSSSAQASPPAPSLPTRPWVASTGSAVEQLSSAESAPVPAASASGGPPQVNPSDTLAAELRSIDEARRAVRQRDGRGALARIERYEAEYPKGHFGQEVAALRIETLMLLGRRAEAAALAETFLRSFPDSALADRVRALTGRSDR